MSQSQIVLEVKNCTKHFNVGNSGKQVVHAVDDVSFRLEEETHWDW